ncbi:MAG: LysE family translocator, partial [Primorskyibacter sp.]
MTLDLLFALFAFALVAVVTPGPNNVMLLAAGANFGLRRSLPHMAGVAMGVPIMVMILGQGVLPLFDAYPALHTGLLVVCILYLLWLAWKIAGAGAPRAGDGDATPADTPLTFLQAVAFQWVNPKAWTMAIGAITVYAPGAGRDPNVGQGALLWVAVAFLCMGMVSTTLWVTLGQQVRRWLGTHRRLRVFNVTMATLMVLSMGY